MYTLHYYKYKYSSASQSYQRVCVRTQQRPSNNDTRCSTTTGW